MHSVNHQYPTYLLEHVMCYLIINIKKLYDYRRLKEIMTVMLLMFLSQFYTVMTWNCPENVRSYEINAQTVKTC